MASSTIESGSSGSTEIFLPRRFLYDKMVESDVAKLDEQVLYLRKYLEKRTNCPDAKSSDLRNKISSFISDFKKRWAAAHRIKERFFSKNSQWLETSISFPNYNKSFEAADIGRPKVAFKEASERTKRMKTQELRTKYSTDELCYAAQMSLRSSGKIDASKLVKEVTSTSPKRATRYKTSFKQRMSSERVQLSSEEALSMLVEAQLTRNQYNIIRSYAKDRFPSYKKLQQTKKDCYPANDDVTVTETLAAKNNEFKFQTNDSN